MPSMQELIKYAKEHDVPIMQNAGLEFLLELIKNNNIKSVLEIGTAIGYSAINMALVGARVSSIEKEFDYYCEAYDNIRRYGVENNVQLIYCDAMLYNTEKQFDLIFIDGAKAQSINFFNQFRKCMHKGSYVVVDNINFHDYTFTDEPLNRDLRELTSKIRRYVEFIQSNNDFETKLYNIGDGLCVSKLIK